jgi:hypothetical protein
MPENPVPSATRDGPQEAMLACWAPLLAGCPAALGVEVRLAHPLTQCSRLPLQSVGLSGDLESRHGLAQRLDVTARSRHGEVGSDQGGGRPAGR